MPKRCPSCMAPMKAESAWQYRIDPRTNRPVLMRNVRRFVCPEECHSTYYDFSRARRVREGDRPPVKVEPKPAQVSSNFNERLLSVGMILSFIFFAAAIAMMPMGVVGKGISWVVLVGLFALLHWQSRIQLHYEPSAWPVPEILPSDLPLRPLDAPPKEKERTAPARTARPAAVKAPAAKPAAAAATAAASATATAVAKTAEAPPDLERKAGEPIKVKIMHEGTEHEVTYNEGENLLIGALDREIQLNYSCLEGMCDSCLVRVVAGANNLSAPTQEEHDMLGDDIKEGMRLACQAKVLGPVVVVQGE